jgi:hypothetical protein
MDDIEAGLLKSQDANLDKVYVDEYQAVYRRHVHTLLAWGYKDSRDKVKSGQDEPAITGFIAEAIQNRLDALDSPSWCNQFDIHEDPPIPSGGRTGRKRWRPDLIFESVERRPRQKYHFEAKRLRDQRSIHAYLGEDGLGCFLSGRYASECDEAGMLGYIQCDNISAWVEKLQLAINQDSQSKNEFLLLSPQRSIQIVDEFPQEWVSQHNRQNISSTLLVHHVLLDYCIPTPEVPVRKTRKTRSRKVVD